MKRWTVRDTSDLYESCWTHARTWAQDPELKKKNSLWKVIWYCAPVCRWTFLLKPSDLWRAAVVCAPMNSPKKSKPRSVFVVRPVSFCSDWFAWVPTMKMSSYFTLNEVIRPSHKSPLFDGEGSRLISWLSFLQIRGSHLEVWHSLFSIRRGCIMFFFALFRSFGFVMTEKYKNMGLKDKKAH